MQALFYITIVLLLSPSILCQLGKTDWPTYGGNAHNDFNVPFKGPSNPNLKVVSNFTLKGQVDGSTIVVLADGAIAFGTADGRVAVLDLSKSALRWIIQVDNGATCFNRQQSNGITGITVDINNNLIVTSRNYYVYSFDSNSGKKIWSWRAPICVETDVTAGIATRPAIGPNGAIYVASGGFLYSIAQGQVNWKVNITSDYPSWLSLISKAAVDSKGTVYIGSSSTFLYAISQTGEVLWTRKTGSTVRAAPVLSPDETIVYITSYDTNAYAIRTSDGSVIWSTGLQSGSLTEPGVLGKDGNIYYAQVTNPAIALTLNGSLLWKLNCENYNQFLLNSFLYPPIVDVQGTAFFGVTEHKYGCSSQIFPASFVSATLGTPSINWKAVVGDGHLSGEYFGERSPILKRDGSVIWLSEQANNQWPYTVVASTFYILA